MSRVELAGPPGMAGLYGRALLRQLPLVGGGGDGLPDTRLVLEDAAIDRDHLRAYADVCGFRLSDAAPPPYLHVLAFPLAMRLMTSREFPFGVMGLVHIANRIEQRRAARAGERVQLQVWAQALADHERGRQFDIVTEAAADGETIWREESTYLRREGAGGARRSSTPHSEPPRAGALWTVPGDVGRRYGAVSGDRNPIHLHGLTARLFGQPKPISHGMWLLARCVAALEGRVPEGCTVSVRFKLPVPLGARVAFISSASGRGRDFEVRSARDGRPHLAGHVEPVDDR